MRWQSKLLIIFQLLLFFQLPLLLLTFDVLIHCNYTRVEKTLQVATTSTTIATAKGTATATATAMILKQNTQEQ